MDTLEKLLDEWEHDCILNSTEPGKELLNIPKLHSKYLKALVKTKLKLKSVRNEFIDTKKIMWNYYKGNYNTDKAKLTKLGREPFKFLLKEDLALYLESDPELVKFTDKITYYEEMAKAIEAILGELKSRTFQLRDLISWEKFIQGS